MRNKQFNLLKVIFFIRYLGDAFFYSFLQLFLAFKGLSIKEVGFIDSLRPMILLFVNPIYGLICKDVNMNRKIMRIITIIEGVLIACITGANEFIFLTLIVVLLSMVDGPFYSLMDGYTVSYVNENNLKFSNIRILGSLAYVFGSIFGGLAISNLGFTITFIISGCLLIISGILLFFTKPLKLKENNKEIKEKSSYKEVLTNKKFYLYTLFYLGIVTISVVGDSFISLYFKDEGIDESTYGFVAAGIIVSEVITMLIYNRFAFKIKERVLYFVIGFAYLFRSLLIGLDLSLFVTIPASLLRGVAFGLLLSVHTNYLRKMVGTKNVTKAIFLLAIITSIIQTICLNISGIIIEKYDYSTLYMLISSVILISLIAAVIYKLLKKQTSL